MVEHQSGSDERKPLMPFMSEEKEQSPRIRVPGRYMPGNSQRFYDDFFEIGFAPMPPPPPLKDGGLVELAKHYLLICCPRAGAYSLPDGLLNIIISDCADFISSMPDNDIFHARQKEPVALAMKESATPGFDEPRRAIASLYLATQFEFYFRILSGLLHPDGTWKSAAAQEKAKSLLPEENRLNGRSISSVELAYRLMVLNAADPRAVLLDKLDKAIRSMFQSQLYANLGGRIKYVRDRGTHGQWGDVSGEGVFYATLTAILFLASPQKITA
jgi:hypothetical protein